MWHLLTTIMMRVGYLQARVGGPHCGRLTLRG